MMHPQEFLLDVQVDVALHPSSPSRGRLRLDRTKPQQSSLEVVSLKPSPLGGERPGWPSSKPESRYLRAYTTFIE